MSTLSSGLVIYLDSAKPGGASPLLEKRGDVYQTTTEPVRFISGDKHTVTIYFVDISSASPEALALPAGWTIVMAAKAADALSGTDVLCLATGFAADGDGYAAALDLNTDEIEDALGDEDEVAALCDVEIRDATNTERITYRFHLTITRQCYQGVEAAPSPGTPAYPLPDDLVQALVVEGEPDPGETEVELDISGFGLAAAPSAVLLTVEIPAGGDLLFAVLKEKSDSAVTAMLSAPTPGAGYIIKALIIP